MNQSALHFLHPESALSQAKLTAYEKLPTQELLDSLQPGEPGALKARPDGTVMDGHHRLKILRDRGVNIDALPREIILKDNELES